MLSACAGLQRPCTSNQPVIVLIADVVSVEADGFSPCYIGKAIGRLPCHRIAATVQAPPQLLSSSRSNARLKNESSTSTRAIIISDVEHVHVALSSAS